MTRKQAVLRAIAILEQDANNKEIIDKLQEIHDDLPMSKWTEKSALDVFEQYISDNDNHFPPKRELGKTLPSLNVLKRLFGITSLDKFRKKYFKNSIQPIYKHPYADYSEEDFLEVFKRNYNRINGGLYVMFDEYDEKREVDTPSIVRIKIHTHCETYDELLAKCGIKKRTKSFMISAIHPEESVLEENIKIIQNTLSEREENK